MLVAACRPLFSGRQVLAGQVGEGGLQLFVPEPEEAVLIGADLVEVQVS
jgi:hypothetical protein